MCEWQSASLQYACRLLQYEHPRPSDCQQIPWVPCQLNCRAFLIQAPVWQFQDQGYDHLPGVTDNDYPAMIEVIQGQAWRLWNEFLEPEFGFKEKHAQFTFSGHRGFHIHVRDPNLLHLDSNARREICLLYTSPSPRD